MKKLTFLFALLTLSVGLWAQDSSSRDDAIDAVNNAASAAITEIQNASTAEAAKQIQDNAIADINGIKDDAIWEIATAYEEMEITMVKDGAIIQIGIIKDQALADIQSIMGQETALKEVHGSQCTPKGLMHNGKYIIKGHFVIVREGMTFNAQGQIIQ